jgi:HEAT repeat protein
VGLLTHRAAIAPGRRDNAGARRVGRPAARSGVVVLVLQAVVAVLVVAGLAGAALAAEAPAPSQPPANNPPATVPRASAAADSGFTDSSINFGNFMDLGGSGFTGSSTGGGGRTTTGGTQQSSVATRSMNLPGVLGVVPTMFRRNAKALLASMAAANGNKPATPAEPGEVKRLAETLAASDESRRNAAAQRLAELGDAASGTLVDLLSNSQTPMTQRAAAAEALLAVGRPATPALVTVLTDENPFVRAKAAEVLGAIGDRTAVRPLARILGDREPTVRDKAAWALGLLGDLEAATPLADLLRRDASLDVRMTAVTALGRLSCRASVEPLLEGLQGEPPRLRAASARAIGGMGEMLASGVRGEIGRAKAGEALMIALQDKDLAVRAAAIDALGALKEQRAVDPLAALVDDLQLGPSAIKAIGRIGTNHARRALQKLAAGPDDTTSAAAREALAQMRARS